MITELQYASRPDGAAETLLQFGQNDTLLLLYSKKG